MNSLAGRLEKETRFHEKMQKKLDGLPPVFYEYYTSMRANRKSYTTIGVYINNIMHFMRFINEKCVKDDFYKYTTCTDVERYMISLETRQTRDGLRRTGDDILQTRWSTLNSFFGWLVRRGYIEANPMAFVERPKSNTEHKVVYLTKREIDALFLAVEKNPDPTLALRDTLLFNLAIATGLRAGALTNINVDDVDFECGQIRVIEKRQKRRDIPIGDGTLGLIAEWLEVRGRVFAEVESPALFLSSRGTRLSCDSANDALKKYCAAAGIQKKITMHKLRASTATNLAAAGVNLQTISYVLGHRSTSTTMRYTAILDENKRSAQEALSKLLSM